MTPYPKLCSWDLKAGECQNSETKGGQEQKLPWLKKRPHELGKVEPLLGWGLAGWLIVKVADLKDTKELKLQGGLSIKFANKILYLSPFKDIKIKV